MRHTAVHTAARTAVFAVALGSLTILALTGCTPGQPAPSSTPSPSASASVEPSVSPSKTDEPAAYIAATSCSGLLGAQLEAEVLATGAVLFSGPGGTGIYPGPSIGQDGGNPISCLYGKDMVDLSTFEFAAQGLSQDAHEGVLAELQTRGMTETTTGTTVVFTQEGTEGTEPAVIHVLRPDSWVTVYSTLGGTASLTKITGWADTVLAQVYP